MEKKKNVQTPQEMAQALEHMAERLTEMDRAEGIFGESMTDEEMDYVAGGAVTSQPDTSYATCKKCGKRFPYSWSTNPVAPEFCSETCRINYYTRDGHIR